MTENIENINNDLTLNAFFGNLDGVKYLIENDADINGRDDGGDTALICAVSMGNFKMVKYLVENGAKIEKGDKKGWTPLIWASKEGYLELVKYLIERGAKVNEKDNNGLTALMYASMISNNLKIEKPLSESEADIIANNNGWTTSKWDLFKHNVKLVEYLIKNGAKVNIKNKEGKTALDLAKNEDIKKLLENAMGK